MVRKYFSHDHTVTSFDEEDFNMLDSYLRGVRGGAMSETTAPATFEDDDNVFFELFTAAA